MHLLRVATATANMSSSKTFFFINSVYTNNVLNALVLKINVPKTETTVNLKSASFVVIMLLHEGLTHIQSQIKPQLLFGKSFALTCGIEAT